MKILFFASLAEKAGITELTVQDIRNVTELRESISTRFPETSGMQFAVAVNQSIVNDNTALNEDDIVALLPPFSGG